MQTSKDIIAFISRNGPSSVREISTTLDLSKADIRYHLTTLLDSKQIAQSNGEIKPPGRGRPAGYFYCVNSPTTDNLKHLINLIISNNSLNKSTSQIADLLWRDEVAKYPVTTSSISRIKTVIGFLQDLGIVASWTAGKTGPQMKIIANPFHNKNPQPFELVVDHLIECAIAYAVNGE